MTHICIGNLTSIGSDNGLSPGRRQAIIWTNAGILLIGLLGTNFSEIFNRSSNIFFQENAFENVVWNIAAILSRPQWVKPEWLTWHCCFYVTENAPGKFLTFMLLFIYLIKKKKTSKLNNIVVGYIITFQGHSLGNIPTDDCQNVFFWRLGVTVRAIMCSKTYVNTYL